MSKKLSDFLNPEQIASVSLPIEQALTFPSLAFTDAGFYQLEVDKIYQKHWVAAFFESELVEVGDLLPFEVCEIPLLAVKGADEMLRVFHNICPYDGCLAVIEKSSGCKEIVTPYHAGLMILKAH